MKIDSYGKSDVGRRRDINEDYFYVDNSKGLFIVCDGLGGHAAGEVASHKAVEYTLEFLDENWKEVEAANKSPIGYFRLTQLIERAVHVTCHRIKQLADEHSELSGMATTLTLLLIVDGNAIVGHVGDSRLYIKRDNGVFQLTTDHTLLNEITEEFKQVDRNEISRFAHFLTRSVGRDDTVKVETLMFEARQGDTLLMCTDGLSNYFKTDKVLCESMNGHSVNEIAESLVQFANDMGGQDNITAVVIKIEDIDDFELNTHRIKLDKASQATSADDC